MPGCLRIKERIEERPTGQFPSSSESNALLIPSTTNALIYWKDEPKGGQDLLGNAYIILRSLTNEKEEFLGF